MFTQLRCRFNHQNKVPRYSIFVFFAFSIRKVFFSLRAIVHAFEVSFQWKVVYFFIPQSQSWVVPVSSNSVKQLSYYIGEINYWNEDMLCSALKRKIKAWTIKNGFLLQLICNMDSNIISWIWKIIFYIINALF